MIDISYDLSAAWYVLATDSFDIVINLDASPLSSRLATIAHGKEKLGFAYHESGYVYPINQEANEWFTMGVFDDVKKLNKKTYQQIAMKICRLPLNSKNGLILNLSEKEKAFAKAFTFKNRLNGSPLIGFNTGAGGRWEHKKWTVEGYLNLAELLKGTLPKCGIILYGGPEERERNKYLKRKMVGPIDAGCDNSLMEFASLIDLCDLLITGDTLQCILP